MEIKPVSKTEYQINHLFIRDLLQQCFCVFDLEATGPEPEEACVTQIGAVIVHGEKIGERSSFSTLVRSPQPIPESIERLTGVTNHAIQMAPSFREAYSLFATFAQDAVLVTQAGYEYDWPLLRHECQRNDLPILTNPILDTKVLFTYLYPDVQDIVSTNYFIKRFQILHDDLKRHDALGDSRLIARIFVKLVEEFSKRGLTDIIIEQPLLIKRMRLDPM